MKFDKSKVYTIVNVDKIKLGMRGYAADDMVVLKDAVEKEDSRYVGNIVGIDAEVSETDTLCVHLEKGGWWTYFYLIEEPKPKEVTAKEWDDRPRLMKVWDDDYSKAEEVVVVDILAYAVGHADCPVIAFISDNGRGRMACYKHCAEIEEPKESETEKHYRPYKNTDEMIEDFKKRYNSYGGWSGKNNPMYCPLIWIVHKTTRNKSLIVSYSDRNVQIASDFFKLESLFKGFTYLDGTPVGMKE